MGGYVNGRRDPSFLPNALLKGLVYARLDRATSEVKAVIEKSHFIAYLPFKKAGIDPYTERVPVTLVYEGTVRGTGGIRIVANLAIPLTIAPRILIDKLLFCGYLL